MKFWEKDKNNNGASMLYRNKEIRGYQSRYASMERKVKANGQQRKVSGHRR